MTEKTLLIQKQNDEFRKGMIVINTQESKIPGQYVITNGITSLSLDDQAQILYKVRCFNNFAEGDDPYGEHDFGAFNHNGQKVYWKIDYYDVNYEYGSEDPSDLNQTRRVLTIMLAQEY